MKKDNISLLAVSFSKGFISPQIPIATFLQGNKKLNFILDTGSDKNVVDESVLNEIEHEKLESANPLTLTGVGGVVEVKICRIPFQNQDDHTTYKPTFLVTDLKDQFDSLEDTHGIKIHGMLGSLFLKEHNLVLDFTNLTAYSKG